MTIRGLDVLRSANVSGYVTFYQIKQYFINIYFFHCWHKVFAAKWNGFAGHCLESPGLWWCII